MSDTSNADQKLKEAYFTASQGQLVWQRFKRNKSALAGAWILIILILSGIFSPFLTPYDATIAGRDKQYLNGAPQIPKFLRRKWLLFTTLHLHPIPFTLDQN